MDSALRLGYSNRNRNHKSIGDVTKSDYFYVSMERCEKCKHKKFADDLLYKLGHEITGSNARIQGLNRLIRNENRGLYKTVWNSVGISQNLKMEIIKKLDAIYHLETLELYEIITQNKTLSKIILGMDKPLEKTVLFIKAVEDVINHEGGYNNIKEDRGGATNYGVSLRFLESEGIDIDGDGDVDWQDVAALRLEKAIDIYHHYFWKNEYDKIGGVIAIKAFDMGVNMGNKRAHKIVQRACNKLGHGLMVDGYLGIKSINVIQQIDSVILLNEICFEQARYYTDIVIGNHTQIKFLRGWMNRAAYKPTLK